MKRFCNPGDAPTSASRPGRRGDAVAAEDTAGTPRPDGDAARRRAFVALGSNLGDRWAFLRLGLAHLPDVVAVSPVYETEPVGGPPGQARYLNAVAQLSTTATPRQLLDAARRAEDAAGRQRSITWGPRTLDVDILIVGSLTVDSPELQVPHARMWERGFVLVPLADLAPDLVGDRLGSEMRAGIALAGTMEISGPPVPEPHPS
jgi:2-amino-4-hydroxy-6-hydroxymethyldihydropteridine diphosphokinase